MTKDKIPITMAVRALRQQQVAFTPFFYDYEEHGGTRTASQKLAINEHIIIKTLVFQDENKAPLLVLMHGDRQVSSKNLARQIACKSVEPCNPELVHKYTGYQPGGVSPFAHTRKMPIFMEKTILDLNHIYINGGKRGFLVRIAPAEIIRVLGAVPVNAAY
jgi:Cys-tRNA(Pro) deacylase